MISKLITKVRNVNYIRKYVRVYKLYSFKITVNAELEKTGHFSWMDMKTDEDEHSIEMHLPYIAKVMEE